MLWRRAKTYGARNLAASCSARRVNTAHRPEPPIHGCRFDSRGSRCCGCRGTQGTQGTQRTFPRRFDPEATAACSCRAYTPSFSSDSLCDTNASTSACTCEPTSALGLGSPRPHLRWDWAHPGHICAGFELSPCHVCSTTGLTRALALPSLLRDRLLERVGDGEDLRVEQLLLECDLARSASARMRRPGAVARRRVC